MNFLTGRRFGGRKDQESNGLVKVTETQSISTIVPQNDGERILLLAYGLKMALGVMIEPT